LLNQKRFAIVYLVNSKQGMNMKFKKHLKRELKAKGVFTVIIEAVALIGFLSLVAVSIILIGALAS